MVHKPRIGNLLVDISVMLCIGIGMFLCEGLLYLFVLRPFGIPTSQGAGAHPIEYLLELIFGIPTVLVMSWAGIVAGILLWSFFANLFSSDHRIEKLIYERHTVNVHYKALLVWGLGRTKFKSRSN